MTHSMVLAPVYFNFLLLIWGQDDIRLFVAAENHQLPGSFITVVPARTSSHGYLLPPGPVGTCVAAKPKEDIPPRCVCRKPGWNCTTLCSCNDNYSYNTFSYVPCFFIIVSEVFCLLLGG